MRAIAGAVVILAGAALWGAGVVASYLAQLAQAPATAAEFAEGAGILLVFCGAVASLLPDRPRPRKGEG